MEKKNYKNILFYFAVFLGLFCIFFFTPYATDDYGEKLSAFDCTWLECIKGAVCYGNGRFLGNIGLYACLHNDLIRIFLKPLFITVLILCSSYVFEIKSLWGRLCLALLIVFPAQGFFSFCYAANPTFFNYTVPIVFFMCALSIIKYTDIKAHSNIILTVLLFIVSVCMQLFSENSSIIFSLFAFCACIFCLSVNKKVKLDYLVLFIGSVIGLAAMMILPKYIEAHFGMKYDMAGYRGIILSIPYMLGVVSQFAEMFSSAFAVILVLSAAEIFIVIKESPDDKAKKWHIAIPAGYSLLSFLYIFFQSKEKKILAPIKLLLLAALMIFLINSFIIVLRFVKEKKDRTVILFLGVLAITGVGMFTVLSQHGYRTYFLPLCLVIGIALYLLKIIKREYKIDFISPKTESALNTALVCACLCFTAIITLQTVQNYDVYCMREKYAAEKLEQGESIIYVPKLPNRALFSEDYMEYCKEYLKQGRNEDAEIVFVDIEEWEWQEKYQSVLDNPVEGIMYSVRNFNFNNGIKK